MKFLESLETLMKREGLNKTQLAAAIGVPKTTVYAWWQRGSDGISITTLKALCAYFGCTLDYLICGEEPQKEKDLVTKSHDERRLLAAYRNADDRARDDAIVMLESHPKVQEKSNPA